MAAMLSTPVSCSSKVGASQKAFNGLPGTLPFTGCSEGSFQPAILQGLCACCLLKHFLAVCSGTQIWTCCLPCAKTNRCQVSCVISCSCCSRRQGPVEGQQLMTVALDDCSSQQKEQASRTEIASAIISTSTAAMLASPIAAEAAVTPSLKNLLFSVTAGGVILVLIVAAITFVSNFDPVARR